MPASVFEAPAGENAGAFGSGRSHLLVARSERLTLRLGVCESTLVKAVVRVRLVSWDDEAARLSAIRTRVFVEEQKVPLEIELDGLDRECVHVLAEDHDGRALGTARLLPDGHIGRMAVLPEARQRGVGSAMLQELLAAARARGLTRVLLHAQLHARGFYSAHGFEVSSAVYLEAGIEHCEMRLSL